MVLVGEDIFEVRKHVLVPKHELLSIEQEEKELSLLEINKKDLPAIRARDPAIKDLKAKKGQIVKITRKSPTLGINVIYRVVK